VSIAADIALSGTGLGRFRASGTLEHTFGADTNG